MNLKGDEIMMWIAGALCFLGLCTASILKMYWAHKERMQQQKLDDAALNLDASAKVKLSSALDGLVKHMDRIANSKWSSTADQYESFLAGLQKIVDKL